MISPDGDGHADVVRVPYRVSEPAHAILLVGSQRVVLHLSRAAQGTLVWTGKLGPPPHPRGRGATCSTSRPLDSPGTVSKPYPFAIVQVRYVVLARPRVTVAPGHRFAIRVSTDAPKVQLAAARPLGSRPQGHAALPRAADSGHVSAVRLRGRTRRALPGGGRVSPDVARAGGAAGAVGLALLLVATRRELRIAGLVAWAAGCGVLATYLAPHGHHRAARGGGGRRLVVAAGGAWLVLRVPWLLAVATLACVPARIPVHVGSTQANLLLPIYGVVVVAALALAWELYGEERARARARAARLAGRAFVGWDGLSLLWSQDVKQGAIELLFFVLPFGLLTLALARLPWSRGVGDRRSSRSSRRWRSCSRRSGSSSTRSATSSGTRR